VSASLWGLQGHGAADLLALCGHFMVLSLLAVGGAITTAPDMHRYLVDEQHWLSDADFNTSIAIAQAAPGPNILFVALMGWHAAGLAGLLATMSGILLPSSILALVASRYAQRNATALPVRAFTAGLMPVTLGLLLSTGWLLTAPVRGQWPGWALVGATVLVSWRTKVSPMWLIALGALAGGLGLV
jgi:chromate transporter